MVQFLGKGLAWGNVTPFSVISRPAFNSGGSAEMAEAWVIKTGHGPSHLGWDLENKCLQLWSLGAWGKGK